MKTEKSVTRRGPAVRAHGAHKNDTNTLVDKPLVALYGTLKLSNIALCTLKLLYMIVFNRVRMNIPSLARPGMGA